MKSVGSVLLLLRATVAEFTLDGYIESGLTVSEPIVDHRRLGSQKCDNIGKRCYLDCSDECCHAGILEKDQLRCAQLRENKESEVTSCDLCTTAGRIWCQESNTFNEGSLCLSKDHTGFFHDASNGENSCTDLSFGADHYDSIYDCQYNTPDGESKHWWSEWWSGVWKWLGRIVGITLACCCCVSILGVAGPAAANAAAGCCESTLDCC